MKHNAFSKKFRKSMSVLGLAALAVGTLAVANNTLNVEAAGNLTITNNTPTTYASICIDEVFSGVTIVPGQSHTFTDLPDGGRTLRVIDRGAPGTLSTRDFGFEYGLNYNMWCQSSSPLQYPIVTDAQAIPIGTNETTQLSLDGGTGTNGQTKTIPNALGSGYNELGFVGIRVIQRDTNAPVTSFCIDRQVVTSPDGNYPISVTNVNEVIREFSSVMPNGTCPEPNVTAGVGDVNQQNITLTQYNIVNRDFAYAQPVTVTDVTPAQEPVVEEPVVDNTTIEGVDDTSVAVCEVPVAIDVLANDLGISTQAGAYDASALTVTTQPANGTAVVNGTDTSNYAITYTPDAGYQGADSFDYSISTTQGNLTLEVGATVDITVTCDDEVVDQPVVEQPIVEDEVIDLTATPTIPSAVEENETISVVFSDECVDLDYFGSETEEDLAISEEYDFPRGLVSFSVNCDQTDVNLYWSNLNEEIIGTNTVKLVKYGAQDLTQPEVKTYFEFPATITYQTIEGVDYLVTSYSLTDNELGDSNPAEGIILDPIGLVLEPQQEEVQPVDPAATDTTPITEGTTNSNLPVTGGTEQTAQTATQNSSLLRSGGSQRTGNILAVIAFSAISIAAIYVSIAEKQKA